MKNALDTIVARKRLEIEQLRSATSLDELRHAARQSPLPRDFLAALRFSQPIALIAEIKKASPSAGLIRPDFDPVAIAQIYASHGAACLSVLTDEHFFQGHLDYLRLVREAVSLPLLRKDFILDDWQVWQARAAGADAVLLIAECLTDADLSRLYSLILDLGMIPLVELYEPENLPRVLSLKPELIGINNRNLKTFETRLEHTIEMRQRIPSEILVVGESGIHSRADVLRLQQAEVGAILVGESLMRSADIGRAVVELLGK